MVTIQSEADSWVICINAELFKCINSVKIKSTKIEKSKVLL